MENKLNYSAIETYAKAYTAKFGDSVFREKEHLSGEDILKFPVKQVGMFVLHTIQASWTAESKKLESPYFNYQAEEVQKGIKTLMNTLSRNIFVNRDNLEQVLYTAVYDTLLLTISPYTYFSNLLAREDINIELLENTARFTVINQQVSEAIIDKYRGSAEKIDVVELLNAVFTEHSDPDDSSTVFDAFSEIHQLNETDFYLTLDDPLDEEDEPIVANENTLNDQFTNGNYETLADQLQHSQPATGSLKSMLSINQKFMFINDLFNDNQDDFNKVMDFLEACDTREAATSFIHNNYLKHNIWNANAPQVKEFLALIDRNFS